MKIAIVKYNAGNIQSVSFALNRLGIEPIITDIICELQSADKVIFPGVGEASSAMKYLKERGLDQIIINLKQPVLGICLGMQLMCRFSEENNTDCLGIFNQDVKLFPPEQKVPHMGWNNIEWNQNPLFNHIEKGAFVYFVHSYYAETGPNTCCTADYILPFSAGLHRDNFYGLQFHPEKSGEVGQKMLENFLKIK